jgi:hypothetical protein
VELLINCNKLRGVTHYLVRWLCHTLAADEPEWLLAYALLNCQEKVAEYDTAAPRRSRGYTALSAVSPYLGAAPPARLTPLIPLAGSRLAAAAELLAGKELVGCWVLYYWLTAGWVGSGGQRQSLQGCSWHVPVVKYDPT